MSDHSKPGERGRFSSHRKTAAVLRVRIANHTLRPIRSVALRRAGRGNRRGVEVAGDRHRAGAGAANRPDGKDEVTWLGVPGGRRDPEGAV
jgi:hypothetical protein